MEGRSVRESVIDEPEIEKLMTGLALRCRTPPFDLQKVVFFRQASAPKRTWKYCFVRLFVAAIFSWGVRRI
jgi:hypothetical protein